MIINIIIIITRVNKYPRGRMSKERENVKESKSVWNQFAPGRVSLFRRECSQEDHRVSRGVDSPRLPPSVIPNPLAFAALNLSPSFATLSSRERVSPHPSWWLRCVGKLEASPKEKRERLSKDANSIDDTLKIAHLRICAFVQRKKEKKIRESVARPLLSLIDV